MIDIDFSKSPGLKEITSCVTAFLSEEEIRLFEEAYGFYYHNVPDKLAVATSGSTGIPKTFLFDRKAVETSIRGTVNELGLQNVKTALLALPLRYVAGRMMLLRAMHMGWKLNWIRPALAWEQIPEVDIAALTPAQLVHNPEVLHRVKVLLVGGGHLTSNALELIKNLSKGRVYQSFSTTETLTNFAFRELAPEYNDHYRVMNGVRIRTDADSVLQVLYPGVTHREVCTGDVVELVDENTFVWRGRKDFIINSGGIKVSPEYLEGLLSEVFDNKLYVVSAEPDEVLGERIVLVMEGSSLGDGRGWMEKIETFYAKRGIHRNLKPTAVRWVDRLPVTPTGKPDRMAVKKLLKKG